MTNQPTLTIRKNPIRIGGKQVDGRLAIPSGIRCTRASTIAWCFDEVETVGVVTTKSISLHPRAGYREPIYARYAPDSYINAVGLSNPGAAKFREELSRIRVPSNKFLLVSIFGGNVSEFMATAEALREVADGFELNMSCPHAEGYGVEIGQKCALVAEITAAVAKATGLPVFVKLSAGVVDLGGTAKASIAAGAVGITVSNTVGPGTVNLNGDPVLSNKVGGLSGTGIRPLALRSVSRVREAVGAGPIIIGMGGISTPDDIRQFHLAGADFFGIGSALTGMDSQRMSSYFDELAMALEPAGAAGIQPGLAEIPMDYFPATLAARQEYGPGLFKLVLDRLPIAGQAGELAGRYVFLFIPGAGEKPFAVFSAKDKSIVIKAVGKFTQHLASVALGSRVYLRGPYGRQFPKLQRKQVVLVGGGTGIASLPEIGELLRGENELHFLLGGRSAHDVFEEETFAKLGTVRVATNDGSKGRQGFVTELLREWVPAADGDPSGRRIFVLCGPEPMVEACRKLLQPSVRPENIWAAIEYMTSCGVGICGKCASPGGSLTCIDGPFMPISAFEERKSDETSCAVPASAH